VSSTAYINTISTIAIAQAQADVLLKNLPEEDLTHVAGNLKAVMSCCEHAFTQWPGQIDKPGMKRLNGILDAFQGSIKSLEIEEFTSTTLAILESLRAKLTENKAGPWKIRAIANLIGAFFKVHKYFDEDLSKYEAYLVAEDLGNRWEQLMEA